MAKRRPSANKPVEAKKPAAKPEVKKAAIPEGLAATFKAAPYIKEAYVLGSEWKFNKVYAQRDWESKYEVVSNPHFKK